MNYRLARVVGIQSPPDGYTVEEKEIEKLVVEETIHSLYQKLPTNRMRFIVASHFELGYPQDIVATILGITQPALVDEIALIQRILLGKPYKPKKKGKTVKLEDVMKLLMHLQHN